MNQETDMSTTGTPEEGMALPTALLAMLILLMLGGLFVSYGVSEQQATRQTQSFETGLHVAESAAEVAIAALADPDQPDQPFVAANTAPNDEPGARQWAVNHAVARVTPGCTNFERTAGGDGIAIIDDDAAVVYGVSFLPSCENRATTRVLRLAFDARPTTPFPATVTMLTGGNLHFDGNARLDGGLHANGNVIGGPHQASGGVSAGGSCSSAHSSCVGGASKRSIPNYTARSFWLIRNQPQVNPNNDPFYELCPDGKVRINSTVAPCDGDEVAIPHPSWIFHTSYTYPTNDIQNRNFGPTWVWNANHGPPDATYYAYRSNVVSNDNSGMGTSSRFTVMAEANRSEITTNGAHSGTIAFTANPKFFASWPGVGVVADVDVVVDKNISAFGSTTLVFAREQFQFLQNGQSERIFYVACDAALTSPGFDDDDPFCEMDSSLRTSNNSPISTTRVTKNTVFDAPGDGAAITPNLGISGVADWQVL
jgi:hypothetical protein